jgi:hypothetical protein
VNQLAQEAVLARLARRLYEEGSWSGETHIQKTTYLARELAGVPLDFEFILYKHGPFSFELRDELASMRVDRLLERVAQGPKYGPRLLVTDRGRGLEDRLSRVVERYATSVDWVAQRVGGKGVLELERLATAQWVTGEMGEDASVEDRARRLTELKPHVHSDVAINAIEDVDRLRAEAAMIAA